MSMVFERMRFSCSLSGQDMLELETSSPFGKVSRVGDVVGTRVRQGWCAGSHARKLQQARHYLEGLGTVIYNREVWPGVIREKSWRLGRK